MTWCLVVEQSEDRQTERFVVKVWKEKLNIKCVMKFGKQQSLFVSTYSTRLKSFFFFLKSVTKTKSFFWKKIGEFSAFSVQSFSTVVCLRINLWKQFWNFSILCCTLYSDCAKTGIPFPDRLEPDFQSGQILIFLIY